MYEFTELFIYKFVFIAELLIAEHLYFFRRKKRSLYPLRIVLGVIACMAIGYAYPIASYSAWYSSLMFLLLFFVCSLSMAFIYEATAKDVFFLSVAAYTTQHLSHEVYAILSNILGIVSVPTMGMYGSGHITGVFDDNLVWINILAYIEVYLACYFVLYKLFGKKVNKTDVQIKNFHIAVISALILVVDIVLNAVAVYVPQGYSETYSYLTGIYNLICCMLILYIQVCLCVQHDLHRELEIMSVMFHESEKKFRQSDENVTLLNMKCHDLKHQIREYADKKEINRDYITDLVNIVDIYDSTVKTGNAAIDLILTEKSLVCKKNKITLTCLADGSLLGFISDTDLYSLFGNIIDNAMEAVTEISDDKKRNINIIVKNVNSFVSISVDNYFTGKLVFSDDGLIKSHKGNDGYHGYGLKSVQMITEKYGGDLNISAKDDIFTLSLLFPLPQKNENAQISV